MIKYILNLIILKYQKMMKFLINYSKNNLYNCIDFADGIFLNEANDNFFNLYKSYDMKQFFRNHYTKFVEKIILKINKIDDFIYVFNLFSPNKNNKIEKNLIDTIINCLWKILEKEENIEQSEIFNEIMMNIIMIYFYNNYKYEEFLNQLNSKEIKKEIIKIFLIIFYGEENKDFIKYSLDF